MTSQIRHQRARILLIDPHKLLPTELANSINTSSYVTVTGTTARRAPTVALLVVAGNEQPHAIVSAFFTTVAAIPSVVYDLTPSTSRQAQVFTAGGNGYATPGISLRELKPMLELAQHGGFSICPGTRTMMNEQLNAPMQFSRREQEVVSLAILGAPIQAIADELHITQPAVDDYLLRAFRKAGVNSLPALATWWTRWVMTGGTSEDEAEDDSMPAYVMSA